MADFKIITNNPMVSAEYPGLAEYYDRPVEFIFITCRNAVHKGAVLINHPLSGSIQPNMCPYKSIVISDAKPQIDLMSIQLIEGALAMLKNSSVKKSITYNNSDLEDFQVIDLDLLNSSLIALPSGFLLNARTSGAQIN